MVKDGLSGFNTFDNELKFAQIDERFVNVDKRLKTMKVNIDNIDKRFESI